MMPPQTRATKRLKSSKEDINVKNKPNVKQIAKKPRKPLADKTNSASDDNASMFSPKRYKDRAPSISKQKQLSQDKRPRRERRLPTRYVENDLLKNLSNNESLSPQKLQSTKSITTRKHGLQQSSKVLTDTSKAKIIYSKNVQNKLDIHKNHQVTVNTRNLSSNIDSPKLINDKKHIGTSKTVNIQSKLQKCVINYNKSKSNDCKKLHFKNECNLNRRSNKLVGNKVLVNDTSIRLLENKRRCLKRDSNNLDVNEFTYDPNKRTPTKLPNKVLTKTNKSVSNKVLVNNTSIRLLENKRRSLKRDSSNLDVYEFTYDPNEEPPPHKKKKRKPVKNLSKTKNVKSKYEKNLARALAALKNTVSSKPKEQNKETRDNTKQIESVHINNIIEENVVLPRDHKNRNISEITENKYNSIRVEDIALQFQDDDYNDDHNIDYSPINSPHNALSSPVHPNISKGCSKTPIRKNDPLNLHDNLSFFDGRPLANSSMNNSIRDPLGSPWRVEFNNLPIKWQVNSYVKPNMTPALDRSFINFNNNKKKHVYTNICVDTNEPLSIVESTPNLKQTSIMSFIREVVENSEKKKKKHKVVQNNSLFNDVTNVEHTKEINASPELPIQTSSSSNVNIQSDKENTHPLAEDLVHAHELKKTEKVKDIKDITYFGFDDSENQENVTPVKKTRTVKKKKKCSRVLQDLNSDINNHNLVVIPVAAKSNPVKTINNINKVFDEVKSAVEPPAFPEVHVDNNIEVTNTNDDLIENNLDDDDSQSVHLFEDIAVIHHIKPSRKSYGKAKKVTFCHKSATINPDSDNESSCTSDEDNLEDLSFKLPSIKQKRTNKKSKKQQKTKKEEKEVEAWAAEFNSMCENVEEFDLVVE